MKAASEQSKHLPLIAIIRGVTPENCLAVAAELVAAGFTMIEVPLNSPNAISSIQLLVEKYGTDDFFIGAGTVTRVDLAKQVIETGANLVVTPNCDVKVIQLCVAAGCATYAGIVTPTEAFAALGAGATGLKVFPVSMVGIDGIKAMLSVLPAGTPMFPVGGINPTKESMEPYINAGVNGFGLGSALFKPSMSLPQIRENAEQFIQQFKSLY